MSKLSRIAVEKKEQFFEFPALPGFEVKLCYHSNRYVSEWIEKSKKLKFEKTTNKHVEEFDRDAFNEVFAANVVLDWKGLKMSYLPDLVVMDEVEMAKLDPEELLEYNHEDAMYLLRNSPAFDAFVNRILNDMGNFNNGLSMKKKTESKDG